MCVLDSVIIVVGYKCSIAVCVPSFATLLLLATLTQPKRLFATLLPFSSPALQRLVFITVITISEVSLLVLIQLSDLKY